MIVALPGLFSYLFFTLCCFVVYCTRRFVLLLTLCHFVLVFFNPFSIAITSLEKERELILVLFVCLFDLCLFGFVFSSSSWCLGRAAVCDSGTPWTFLLPFFGSGVVVVFLWVFFFCFFVLFFFFFFFFFFFIFAVLLLGMVGLVLHCDYFVRRELVNLYSIVFNMCCPYYFAVGSVFSASSPSSLGSCLSLAYL